MNHGSHYFDAPEGYEMTDDTRDLAETLARSAAACVHAYGPDHIGVWDERTNRFAAGMLHTIHEHGGKIIYAGSKPLPAEDSSGETWRRHDAPAGERRGWVEIRMPDADS